MAERYRRIKTMEEMRFQEDSPIFLEKAALLLDQQKEINIFQGKFTNIQNQPVSAVYIDIVCFDIFGKELGTVQGLYLDMNIAQNQSFGTNVPVEIPFSDAREFEIIVTKVAYADGNVNELNLPLHQIKGAESLDSRDPYKQQYIREIHLLNAKVNCNNMVVHNKEYWICSCGTLNNSNSSVCRVCNLNIQKQLEVSDFSYLKQRLNDYKEKLQIENQMKIEAAHDKKRKIIHRSALGVLVIGILCLVTFPMLNLVTQQIKSSKYSMATKKFKDKNYAVAIKEFQDLGNYHDSKEKMIESKYLLSKQYIEEEKYDKAKKMLGQIKEYADSVDLIKECQYQKAIVLVNKHDYDSAKSILESIHDYKDADQYIIYIDTINANIEIFDATKIYNTFSKLDIDIAKDYLNNNELMKVYIKKLCGNVFYSSYTFIGTGDTRKKVTVKRDDTYIFKLSEGVTCRYKNYGAAGYDGSWASYGPLHVVNINGKWYEGMIMGYNSKIYEKGYREIEIINSEKIKITYISNGKSHIYKKKSY